MALYVIATPIGNPADISTRARELLSSADLVVGEELKALRQILKSCGVQAKATDQLNEHSDARDFEHLAKEAQNKLVALVSDCGTPGFCDPGAELVAKCVKMGVTVHSVPGPSSLMAMLSIAGHRVDQFVFGGFLPAKAEERKAAFSRWEKERLPVILMEAPYRLKTFVDEIAMHFSSRQCVVAVDLTQPTECVLRGPGKSLPAQLKVDKGEPIALIMPT